MQLHVRALALATCLCLAAAASAQERRAATVDDLLNLVQVSGAEISPDGKQVIYTKSELKKWSDNKRVSSIWIANADGTDHRQLLGHERDRSPAWSPDGRYGDALLRGNMKDIGGGDYWDAMTGVDAVIAQGIADPDQLAIRGWSYGGILGGWTVTQTERFKAASLGAMVSDWASEYAMGFNHDVRLWYIGGTPWENPEAYRRQSSYTYINKVTTPTLLLHGERRDLHNRAEHDVLSGAEGSRHHAALHSVPTRAARLPRAASHSHARRRGSQLADEAHAGHRLESPRAQRRPRYQETDDYDDGHSVSESSSRSTASRSGGAAISPSTRIPFFSIR